LPKSLAGEEILKVNYWNITYHPLVAVDLRRIDKDNLTYSGSLPEILTPLFGKAEYVPSICL